MKLFKLVAATTEMKSMAWLCLTYILLHVDENWNYLGFCDMLSWINWYGSQPICVAGYWSLSHFWYVAGISVIIFIFSCYLKEVNGSVVIQTRALNSWNTLKLFSLGTLSTNYGFFFFLFEIFFIATQWRAHNSWLVVTFLLFLCCACWHFMCGPQENKGNLMY